MQANTVLVVNCTYVGTLDTFKYSFTANLIIKIKLGFFVVKSPESSQTYKSVMLDFNLK